MKLNKFRCSSFCSFYRGEKFIKGYLDDVLKQTIFSDIEFIFLDCNSPENEKEYILPLTEEYHNIKYFRLDQDPGLYAGWNYAISLCSSEIIGNWNIDDRKSINSFEILLDQLDKNPQVDIIYGITYISHIANEKYEENSYDEIYPCLTHSLQNLFNHNSPHCMPLWRKSLHDRFGNFDENLQSAADGDLWLRCACRGATIKMVNHPVGLYYHNPDGRSTETSKIQERIDEVNKMRQKHINYINNQFLSFERTFNNE